MVFLRIVRCDLFINGKSVFCVKSTNSPNTKCDVAFT